MMTKKVRQRYWKVVVLLLVNCCIVEPFMRSSVFRKAAEGHRLKNALIKEKEIVSPFDCAHLCLTVGCKSINLGKKKANGKITCQMNNKTSSELPAADLVVDSAFDYMEPLEPPKPPVDTCSREDGLPSASTLAGMEKARLDKLREWLGCGGPWKRCWKASVDGWAVSVFHAGCDNKGPTVTIVKVGVYVFGGYATVSWASSGGQASAPGSFMFSLKNSDNLGPIKLPLMNENDGYAIYRDSGRGPAFGTGYDLYIRDNAQSSGTSSTNPGYTYALPPGYTYDSVKANTLLHGGAGEYFTATEVEVFYRG